MEITRFCQRPSQESNIYEGRECQPFLDGCLRRKWLGYCRSYVRFPEGRSQTFERKRLQNCPAGGLIIWKKTRIASGSLQKSPWFEGLPFFLHVLKTLQMCSMYTSEFTCHHSSISKIRCLRERYPYKLLNNYIILRIYKSPFHLKIFEVAMQFP